MFIVVQPQFLQGNTHRPFEVTRRLADHLYRQHIDAYWIGGRSIRLSSTDIGQEVINEALAAVADLNHYAAEIIKTLLVRQHVVVTTRVNGVDPARAAKRIAAEIGGNTTSRENIIYLPPGVDERDLAHALYLAFGTEREAQFFLW